MKIGCQEYHRQFGHVGCQVSEWLDVIKKLSGRAECHHIFGKVDREFRDYFCNLILMDSFVHDFCHSAAAEYAKFKVTLCCIREKMRYEQERLAHNETYKISIKQKPEYMIWNLPAMDKLAEPFDGLRGKVEFMKYKVIGTLYEFYANEILEFLNDREKSV